MTGKDSISDSGLYKLLKEVSSRGKKGKVQHILSLKLSMYRKSQRSIKVVGNRTVPDLNFYGIIR